MRYQAAALDKQVTDVTEQARVTENARSSYANTVEYAQEADRFQTLSDVAGGGDPDQIRHAVLAAADEYADKFHQLSATQAKTFEQMNTAQAHLKGMQDELVISQRAQTKIEADIKAAQAAGHDDEVASLQKELEFRTGRTGDLQSRIAQQEPIVKDLQTSNTVQNDELLAAKQQSEELRNLARGNPDELERQFTEKQLQADHNTQFFRPQDGSDEDTLGRQLESEANATATDTTTQPTQPTGEQREGEEPTGTPTTDSQTTDPTTDTTTQPTQPTEGEQEGQERPAGDGTADPGANLDNLDESGNVQTPPPDAEIFIPDREGAAASDTTLSAAPNIVDSDMLTDPQTTNAPDVDTPATSIPATVDVMAGTDPGAPTSIDDTTMNPPAIDTPPDTDVNITPPEHEDDGGFSGPDDSGGDGGGGDDGADMADAGMAE
jgi:hypothetical protein